MTVASFSGPEYFTFEPVVDAIHDGSRFADYINHCAEWRYYSNNLTYDKPTAAHECTHGINAALRNSSVSIQAHRPVPVEGVRGGTNAFYVGENRAIRLPEPAFRKSAVGPAVPASMREYRYRTYVVGQSAWDDTPLYLFDEWVAYLNGTEVAVASDYNERTDQALGPTEFLVYCTALMRVCHDRDKTTYDKIFPFYSDMVGRSMWLIREALKKFPWDSAERIWNEFQNSDFRILGNDNPYG